jgi:hypothetical protein
VAEYAGAFYEKNVCKTGSRWNHLLAMESIPYDTQHSVVTHSRDSNKIRGVRQILNFYKDALLDWHNRKKKIGGQSTQIYIYMALAGMFQSSAGKLNLLAIPLDSNPPIKKKYKF